jgi:hypothetical protein
MPGAVIPGSPSAVLRTGYATGGFTRRYGLQEPLAWLDKYPPMPK